MKTRTLQALIRVSVMASFALASCCYAQLTGTIEATRIEFVNGKPSLAQGTGTIKNDKGETIAAGPLIVGDGTISLLGQKGASFTLAVSPTTPPPEDWTGTAPADVAQVAFDGKDKWTLKDGAFLFLLEFGANARATILADKSLLSSTNITFPEGKYVMWQHSITVGAGGGSVVFKQGHPVDGDNATIDTPDKKNLKFPQKGASSSK